ncbi:hypothetical protein BCR44DRAFT_1440716, partial [Catenaria anguillulae PL171]
MRLAVHQLEAAHVCSTVTSPAGANCTSTLCASDAARYCETNRGHVCGATSLNCWSQVLANPSNTGQCTARKSSDASFGNANPANDKVHGCTQAMVSDLSDRNTCCSPTLDAAKWTCDALAPVVSEHSVSATCSACKCGTSSANFAHQTHWIECTCKSVSERSVDQNGHKANAGGIGHSDPRRKVARVRLVGWMWRASASSGRQWRSIASSDGQAVGLRHGSMPWDI